MKRGLPAGTNRPSRFLPAESFVDRDLYILSRAQMIDPASYTLTAIVFNKLPPFTAFIVTWHF
ncbi:hypothetical protein A8C56_10105 [Niabella ginsenosidivorans]|uniref:Uncharacterized protein n=1 Tax=Niabella ginsenosidivorans TaxID=1176587 RepID=A0A1A9I3J6_9BACT|nr:hypothetical protein A8C56_10105 [Niabella ginsenosidivorans]